ncbi:MAG: ribonuclease HII [Clostridia bacterium]|nr:ribonuclease HII [Clostridia bacterium]
MKTIDLFEYDKQISLEGYKYICGIDEAGRGPLAGPVSVGCVIMPLDDMIDGINDSKKLSEKKREALYDIILDKAISYSIVLVDNMTIDRLNILEATKSAMIEALSKLSVSPDLVLIDAVKLNCDYQQRSIIKGDATSYNVAAASILAKVTRDRLMREYDAKYPQYQFEKNKGYGTKVHVEALKEYGPTKIHRKTFIGNFVDITYKYEDVR